MVTVGCRVRLARLGCDRFKPWHPDAAADAAADAAGRRTHKVDVAHLQWHVCQRLHPPHLGFPRPVIRCETLPYTVAGHVGMRLGTWAPANLTSRDATL